MTEIPIKQVSCQGKNYKMQVEQLQSPEFIISQLSGLSELNETSVIAAEKYLIQYLFDLKYVCKWMTGGDGSEAWVIKWEFCIANTKDGDFEHDKVFIVEHDIDKKLKARIEAICDLWNKFVNKHGNADLLCKGITKNV